MIDAAHEELRRDLGRRIEREQADLVLLALHIGCGGFALGITGEIVPLFDATAPEAST